MGFDSIVLKNSMAKFGVKRPKDGKYENWYFVDSLKILRGKIQLSNLYITVKTLKKYIFSGDMPSYESKSLNNCMGFYFGECQPWPHSALDDAKCVKRLCEKYARKMRYTSFGKLISQNKVAYKF